VIHWKKFKGNEPEKVSGKCYLGWTKRLGTFFFAKHLDGWLAYDIPKAVKPTYWADLNEPRSTQERDLLADHIEGHRRVTTCDVPSTEKGKIARAEVVGHTKGLMEAAEIVRKWKDG